MRLDIGWASPSFYSYAANWWADLSWGCGTEACHFQVVLLGFHIEVRVYGKRE